MVSTHRVAAFTSADTDMTNGRRSTGSKNVFVMIVVALNVFDLVVVPVGALICAKASLLCLSASLPCTCR